MMDLPKHKGSTMGCRNCGTSWDDEKTKRCPYCEGQMQVTLVFLDQKYEELNNLRRDLVAQLDIITLLRDKIRR